MSRYFMEISFRGTHYHGWQLQPNAPSVQEVIEKTLKTLTRENIKTTGAGRTDAGVHARCYTAHFDGDHPLFKDRSGFIYKMNALLPTDIAIHDIYDVRHEAHARYSATSRAYEYRISMIRDPFDVEFSWYYSLPLNLDALNHASVSLKEYTDFTSFSKLHSDVKTNICHIIEARWRIQGQKLIFRIRADRFLRNMVRALVGTMVDVGRGKISQEGFIRIIKGRNRGLAGFSAPAKGLSLVSIEYPEDIRI